MKFFEDQILQARKRRHLVCGDYYFCKRFPKMTVAILADGVGSGVYANIAAIACGDRLMALMEAGLSLRSACGQVAESMHRARSEEAPFAAFVAVRILPGGQFTAYAYENPEPVLIRHGRAEPLKQQFIALKYEMIAESSGMLEEGDSLLLCSDGVTHAGLGGGFATGWGIQGLAQEIDAFFRQDGRPGQLLSSLLHTTYLISGRAYWDDTSLAMLTCRPARELCVLTGPPKHRSDDARMIDMFEKTPGKKVICGSTTADIASRVLGRKTRIVSMDLAMDRPPEYTMDGVDLMTEGIVTLNQAMNLLEDVTEPIPGDESPVLKLCAMLMDADVITFIIGQGYNAAQYEDTLFKQLGVKPRQRIVKRMARCLRDMGKLVIERRI